MKTIEFNPEGKTTMIPTAACPEEPGRSEILAGALPVILHKLKNKLTPILGYTQILLARTSDEFIKERLEKIERNTYELAESLDMLKDYCRAGSGRKKRADLNGIVAGLSAEWQGIAAASGARIVVELAPELPALELDAAQLRILLLHLVENAVSALKLRPHAAPEIRLSTRAEGRELALVVCDNGCGISEEDVHSVWMPFFSRFPDHAGLGLVLCERILANHGATCTVTSVAGESTRFEVRFPLPAVPDAMQRKSVKKNIRSRT